MSEFKYQRLISAAARVPWALAPHKLAVIQEVLELRANGQRFTPAELRARLNGDDARAAATPAKAGSGDGLVAVIPVHGVIANRTFEASSGMMSTESLTRMFRAAMNDDRVTAIVFDHASPGGAVPGVPELAGEIRAARGQKAMVAIANSLMASASYWLASQADEIVMTPSAEVGSIGVWSLHQDVTSALEKEGITVTSFVAGERKLEGAPWIPLDDEARAHFQALVDETYQQFLADVAKGRGVTVTQVKKSYGAGRVFTAKDAKARGMVDRIGTLDEVIARLSAKSRRSSATSTAALAAGPAVMPAAQLPCPVSEDGRHVEGDEENEDTCVCCGADLLSAAPAAALTVTTDGDAPGDDDDRRSFEAENMDMDIAAAASL